jgi:serine/threonine protein kinase
MMGRSERMKDLRGYQLELPWKISPNGKYTFAKKDGETYFVKEFMTPKFPREGTCDPDTYKRRVDECADFERHQKNLIRELKRLAGEGGNLVVSIEFFRENTTYYKVTKKIEMINMKPSELSALSFAEQVLLIKTIAFSLGVLHRVQIVHGDLKPENLLITRTAGGKLVAKIIDFDSSYFEDRLPKPMAIVGDMRYYSPELGAYVMERTDARKVSCKSDIYALAIIFHEFMVGKKPDSGEFHYLFERVLNDKPVEIDHKIRSEIAPLVRKMLDPDPEKRPSIQEVFRDLTALATGRSLHSPKAEVDKPAQPDSRDIDYIEILNALQCLIYFKNGDKLRCPKRVVESKGWTDFIKGGIK